MPNIRSTVTAYTRRSGSTVAVQRSSGHGNAAPRVASRLGLSKSAVCYCTEECDEYRRAHAFVDQLAKLMGVGIIIGGIALAAVLFVRSGSRGGQW